MSFSFGRELRLCSAADFKQVFDHTDIKVSNRHLLILARENNLDHPRLGLVIAKKNIRFANGRNRVKRHIRETYRLNQDCLGNLDIVVLARRGLGELESSEINKLLTRQWSKLHQKLGDRQAKEQVRQQKQQLVAS